MPTKTESTATSTIRVLAAALALVLYAATVQAGPADGGQADETTAQVLLDAIRSNRKALIAVNLGLSDDEAAKFWPLYDRYQKEIYAVGDRLIAVIQQYTAGYREMSNDTAMKLVDEYLAVEADRIAIRRRYVPEFAAILPGRTVARLYQLENKMDAVIRYDLAASIPVMDEAKH
jgi:hypothetical protein